MKLTFVIGVENIENEIFNMFNTAAITAENFKLYCFKIKN